MAKPLCKTGVTECKIGFVKTTNSHTCVDWKCWHLRRVEDCDPGIAYKIDSIGKFSFQA